MRLKKIGEESAELVVACVDKNKISIAEEAADLFYHALVAIRAEGVTLQDVEEILEGRAN
jgi:phosphoribosyl-ATP pyrophosphohydrolase/phosphoribosyl-AMP cyclohydrolase